MGRLPSVRRRRPCTTSSTTRLRPPAGFGPDVSHGGKRAYLLPSAASENRDMNVPARYEGRTASAGAAGFPCLTNEPRQSTVSRDGAAAPETAVSRSCPGKPRVPSRGRGPKRLREKIRDPLRPRRHRPDGDRGPGDAHPRIAGPQADLQQ
ncbi:hypothetical protein GCM10010236_70660 [Streptomyces eurythermus]|nr:hypothetical protein GCM10010236_70660 [Streptomyces eurythermus]